MKQLELKYLAPYLPYDLRLYWHSESDPVWHEMDMFNIHNVIQYTRDYPEDKRWKPILRPLSDLTKEIEINGEKFVPFEKLGGTLNGNDGESMYITHLFNCSLGKVEPKFLPYWVVVNFFEWHFDFFGLIPEGLAVDINTIE